MSEKFLDRLPGHYAGVPEVAALQEALQQEAAALRTAAEDLVRQLFVDTATWGLTQWEAAHGLPTNPAAPLSERREIVKAALRGSGTCTVQLVKDTALAYTNAEIELREEPAAYRFVIKFVGKKGRPPNMEAFCHTMDAIKPAHLAYTLEYTYATWGEVREKTWAQLRALTWDQVRVID